MLPAQWSVIGVDDEGIEACSFTTSCKFQQPQPGKHIVAIRWIIKA